MSWNWADNWWGFVFIAIAGWLATDIWRWLGVLAGNRLDESSEALNWVRAVATALVAAVVAKLIIFPTGTLEQSPSGCASAPSLSAPPPSSPPAAARRGHRDRHRDAGLASGGWGSDPSPSRSRPLQRLPNLLGMAASTALSSIFPLWGCRPTPSFRGMTWKWRWKTDWPAGASLNCMMVIPSASKAS